MSAVTVITLTPDQLREIIREEVRALSVVKPAPEGSRILTTEEAAAHARRSPETIREWVQIGRLKALPRSGRQHYQFRLEELEKALVWQPESPELDAEARADAIIRSIRG